jgi:sugar-phosphatase
VHGWAAADTVSAVLPNITDEQVRRHVREVWRIQEVDPSPGLPVFGGAALVDAIGEHRWAVVTGCSTRMATARLAAAGLPSPDVLITAEDVDHGKPHPDGYLLALHRLGVAAADAVAVEDAPVGVAAAKSAGIRTLAVTTTHPAQTLSDADAVVMSLDQITVTASDGRLSLVVAAAL